jgi:hypothetical protein
LSERLAGVVAAAPEPLVVGGGARTPFAATRSALPDALTTEDEVRYFVTTLLDRNSIAFDGGKPRPRRAKRPARRGAVAAAGAGAAPATAQSDVITHVVKKGRGGRKVLSRVRFACGCRAHAR